jgi:hypothetical protein
MTIDDILKDGRLRQARPKLYQETFNFWMLYLLERVNNMYVWKGLPDSIPAREIEMRLNMAGQCFISDDYDGLPRVFWCNPSDLTGIYLDVPKSFNVYSGTVFSANIKATDGVHIRNNDYTLSTRKIIEVYADKLAHCDLTLVNVLVNMRSKNVPVSASSKLTTRLKTWYKNIYSGKQTPIEDPSYSALEIKNMDMGASMQLRDLAEVRQNIFNEFYNAIGLRQAHIKKAQQNSTEIESGDGMLLLNISNGLKCRQDGAEAFSNFFGGSVTVDYCDEIKMQFEEPEAPKEVSVDE